jgi:hypothetical protein
MTTAFIAIAILYLFTVAGFLALLWRRDEQATNERLQMDARARMERDALLERIQRPEFRPVLPDMPLPDPAPEPFEEALVGMVVDPPASPEPEDRE